MPWWPPTWTTAPRRGGRSIGPAAGACRRFVQDTLPRRHLRDGGRQPQRGERVGLRRRHQGLPGAPGRLLDLREAAVGPGRSEAVRHPQGARQARGQLRDRLQAGRLDRQLRHRARGAGLGGEGPAPAPGRVRVQADRPGVELPPAQGRGLRAGGLARLRPLHRRGASSRRPARRPRCRSRRTSRAASPRRPRRSPRAAAPRRAGPPPRPRRNRGQRRGPQQGRAWTAGPTSWEPARSPRRSSRPTPACGPATPSSGRPARSTSSSRCPVRAGTAQAVRAKGQLGGTEVAKCLLDAVRTVKFPEFQRASQTFSFSVRLQGQ